MKPLTLTPFAQSYGARVLALRRERFSLSEIAGALLIQDTQVRQFLNNYADALDDPAFVAAREAASPTLP